MPWSIQLGRVLGIPIRLHLTFVLLIGWLFAYSISRGEMTNLYLALGLFACVLLHELGHSVAARRFGVDVVDITLLPIGGVARMGNIPEQPRQELIIALAGPIVNFVLVPLFLGGHWLWERSPTASPDAVWGDK